MAVRKAGPAAAGPASTPATYTFFTLFPVPSCSNLRVLSCAGKAIAAGKGEFELVENGIDYRASAIPLGNGCVICHTGFFSKTPQTQRFAGRVISVPVNKK
jgi:hypothetical protein